MHRSHIPVQEWFWAAYLVTTHTPGISAVQLARQLGLSSATTAWHMLHRLRKGMVNDNRSHLSGLIEADESIIGGTAKGKPGRGSTAAKHKSLLIGAVEVLPYEGKKGKRCERAGRLRLSILKNAGEHSIREFLTDNIQARSTLRTDGWRGYTNAALVGYTHRVRLVRTPERARWRHISIGSSAISRRGSMVHITGWSRSISRTIWTSLCSASTDARRQWQRFRLYSESQRRKPRYR